MTDEDFSEFVARIVQALRSETQDPEEQIVGALGAAALLTRTHGVSDEGVQTALSEILTDVERVH